MTIRAKLFATAGLLTLVVAALVVFALIFAGRLKTELHHAQAAQEVAQSITELTLLTESYISHREPRMAIQWRSRSERIATMLADPAAHSEIRGLALTFQSLIKSFEALDKTSAQRNRLDATSASEPEFQRLELAGERIAARMRTDSHHLISKAFIIAQQAQNNAQRIQQRGSSAISAIGVVLVLISIGATLLVARNITRDINILVQGAGIMGQGQLDHRIRRSGNDEIGILARAFNAMAENIQKLTLGLEERVKRRTQALEAANKELEAFSYSVSHDLRAPLRAIDGFTRILLEDHAPRLDAEGNRVCTIISANSRKMGRLIDDLLAFSRLGRAALQITAVDMTALVDEVYQELTTPMERERIDFHREALPPAMGDPKMIRQVWTNLLSNAVKFTAKRKQARITVDATDHGDEVVYCVRDNGAGFEMQYVDKIFAVFQRLHTEREFPGTGVGLALVQRIIFRHGGRIWAEGAVDQGAAFHFALQKRKVPE